MFGSFWDSYIVDHTHFEAMTVASSQLILANSCDVSNFYVDNIQLCAILESNNCCSYRFGYIEILSTWASTFKKKTMEIRSDWIKGKNLQAFDLIERAFDHSKFNSTNAFHCANENSTRSLGDFTFHIYSLANVTILLPSISMKWGITGHNDEKY